MNQFLKLLNRVIKDSHVKCKEVELTVLISVYFKMVNFTQIESFNTLLTSELKNCLHLNSMLET